MIAPERERERKKERKKERSLFYTKKAGYSKAQFIVRWYSYFMHGTNVGFASSFHDVLCLASVASVGLETFIIFHCRYDELEALITTQEINSV